ncbi:hypothetical protein BU16DRAFT_535218 [Lophium mytilinum]|uniref:Uncharacterized protein n=1 Tax=Lophium mytilinum TaxID=390894 RepID=A0A6A6R8C5_9PEZI|nr:hypothetical protein BU16DRAFT_535218 [Lophium mytilinum]
MTPFPPTVLLLLVEAKDCELLEQRILEKATQLYGPLAAGHTYSVITSSESIDHANHTIARLVHLCTTPSPTGAEMYAFKVLAWARGTSMLEEWLRRSEAMELLLEVLEGRAGGDFFGRRVPAGPMETETGEVMPSSMEKAFREMKKSTKELREAIESSQETTERILEAFEMLTVREMKRNAMEKAKGNGDEGKAAADTKGKGKAKTETEGKVMDQGEQGKATAGIEEKGEAKTEKTEQPKPEDSQ